MFQTTNQFVVGIIYLRFFAAGGDIPICCWWYPLCLLDARVVPVLVWIFVSGVQSFMVARKFLGCWFHPCCPIFLFDCQHVPTLKILQTNVKRACNTAKPQVSHWDKRATNGPSPQPKFLFFVVSGYSVHADVEAGVQVRMEPGKSGNSATLVSQIIVTGVEDSFILDKSSSTANQTDFGHSFRSLFGLTCAPKEFATDKNPRDAELAELKMLLTVGMWKPDLFWSHLHLHQHQFYGSNFPDFRAPGKPTNDWQLQAGDVLSSSLISNRSHLE